MGRDDVTNLRQKQQPTGMGWGDEDEDGQETRVSVAVAWIDDEQSPGWRSVAPATVVVEGGREGEGGRGRWIYMFFFAR